MYFCRPPWIFARNVVDRDEHDVVVVLPLARLPLRASTPITCERDVRDADGLADRSALAPKSCSTTVCPSTTTLAPGVDVVVR